MAEHNKPSPNTRRAGDSSGTKTRHKAQAEKKGEAGKFAGKTSERLEKRLNDKGGEAHGDNFKNRDANP